MDLEIKKIKRFFPIIIIIILMVMAYFSEITGYLTKENFEYIHRTFNEYVYKHPYLSPLMFIGIYIIYASLALPGVVLLTILGGFIFPQPLSTLYVLVSATLGGSILFLSTKKATENFPNKKNSYFISKMEKGFQQNAACYLLLLRLIPLFPCWLVTVASAIFQVKLKTFIWTTFIGISPCVFFLTQMGASIIMLLEYEGPWTVSSLLIRLHH
ncbi:MAG: TVP38/TMEM64 family protein [Parachlamydiaceae bacterium]|nr:TVP38/TMEM64 family protein [Parachlamydiaceae bacterium]